MKTILKTLSVLITLCICGYMPLKAQTYEEYRKKEIEDFKKFVQQEQIYIARMAKEINDYLNKQDKEYKDYLNKEWKAYNAFAAEKRASKPKPAVIPDFKREEKGATQKKVANLTPVKTVVSKIPSKAPFVSPPVTKSVNSSLDLANARVNFYGVPVYLSYDPAFDVNIFGVSGEKAISAYWERASASGYSSLIEQLSAYKASMNLNDYCYYLLVNKVAQNLYPGNREGEILSTWFMMVRSGYGVRIGFESNGNLLLLMPSYNSVYGMKFLKEGDKYLYIVTNTTGSSIRTYDRDFLTAGKVIDFNIYSPMNLGGKLSSKNLDFTYKDTKYSILVNYDQGLVDLYKDYPQLEMPVYFNAAVSVQAKESIAASLKPIIAEMNEQQAVEFLLSFTQNSFKYKTDLEQFGYEKFFFAEELLFYPYSDCEDRSVLFSYLVRDLVGLDMVGVEFPDHMATAVRFSSLVEGDHINLNKTRYVIADPTYFGAPVGSAMPQYRESSPIVIPMNNIRGASERENQVWSAVQESGCYPGSNLRNISYLSDGSTVLTGFYTGIASFAGKILPNAGELNRGFVGRMSGDNAVWVLPMESTGNSVGISVAAGKGDDIYVAGSFRGNLSLGGSRLSSNPGSGDAFVACISKSGAVKWLSKLNLDTIPGNAPIAFSATYNTGGAKLGLTRTIAPVDFKGYGLFAEGDGNIVYNGIVNRIFSSTPEVAKAEYASAAVAATPEMLKKETDAMVMDNTDKGIAGLFAAILLVKNMGATLSGNDARGTLDKYNPIFSKNCPNLYRNLGMINFVKNSNGVISIQTQNGKDIYFDQIRVKNNANINIVQQSNGNLTVQVLTGVLVGKMVVWFKLNHVELVKKSGDMVFDYDKDHSTAQINMTKDILL
ncbi:MAG TPA: hypothetical protein DEO54_02000 [Rikenellaceae bacterium]|nr:MAG: hypothetical protein A2X20_12040 [Bacteroidetes bacterium GWE2_40_15]HBZ24999.1 hypothetical protein [Rikenellaceae bacterium]